MLVRDKHGKRLIQYYINNVIDVVFVWSNNGIKVCYGYHKHPSNNHNIGERKDNEHCYSQEKVESCPISAIIGFKLVAALKSIHKGMQHLTVESTVVKTGLGVGKLCWHNFEHNSW